MYLLVLQTGTAAIKIFSKYLLLGPGKRRSWGCYARFKGKLFRNLACSFQNLEEPYGTSIPSLLELYEYMYFKRQDSFTFMHPTVVYVWSSVYTAKSIKWLNYNCMSPLRPIICRSFVTVAKAAIVYVFSFCVRYIYLKNAIPTIFTDGVSGTFLIPLFDSFFFLQNW